MWLLIAGRLASGKTTAALALAPNIGATVVTVSTAMKDLSATLGVPFPDRRQLQELGSVLAGEGPQALGTLLIKAAGERDRVILDGLRLIDVALWLKDRLDPGVLRVVYLDASSDVRRARYDDRGDNTAFEQADDHAVERGAMAMREIADWVIDARKSVVAVQAEVLAVLAEARDGVEGGGGGNT